MATTNENTGITVAKQAKPAVERLYCAREVHGGKLRRVTIRYRYDRKYKQLTYAGVIFCTNVKHPEKYNQLTHTQTAESRFKSHPIVIDNFEDKGSLGDFNRNVRQQLFKHGCRTKNHVEQ